MAKGTAVSTQAAPGTEVAPISDALSGGALASMFEEGSGQGFENADASAYAIPFIQILQSGSPQCKRSDGAYIKGAEEGMFLNTVTQEVTDGAKGIRVIPCFYRRVFIEWKPRDSGGGFVAEHPATSPLVSQTVRTEKGDQLPNGNFLVDTRSHYLLLVRDDGAYSPAVVTMTSTQVKKSRQWMSRMESIKFKNAAQQLYTPPMFSHIYTLTTTAEQNDAGSWFGWRIGDAERLEDAGLFAAAKDFKRAIAAGEVKEQQPVAPSQSGGVDLPEDQVPF